MTSIIGEETFDSEFPLMDATVEGKTPGRVGEICQAKHEEDRPTKAAKFRPK